MAHEHAASLVTLAPVSLSEPLMTAAEVARLLGVPRSSIYEYARRQLDPLPAIEIGRHRRFLRSDVEHWLGEQRAHRLTR
jgi:excisionase family DNA binding protein